MPQNKVEFLLIAKDQASGAFNKTSSAIKAAGVAVAAATAAVAGVGAAVFTIAKDVARAEDAIGKFAQRLGTSADVISRFHQLAGFAGISINTMDLGLQRMNRKLGDAINQGGAAATVFTDLGLNLEELASLNMEDRFLVIADAMNTMENDTQRLSAAVRIFDSEGAAMLQLTDQGSASIRAMAADLEFLGATVTPQAAANAAVFNDQLQRFDLAIQGARNEVSKLFPLMSGIIKAITDFIASNRVNIVGYIQEIIVNVTASVFFIRDATIQIKKLIDEAFNSEETFNRFIDNVSNVGEFLVTLLSSAALEMASKVAFQFQRIFNIVVNSAKIAWENIKRIFAEGFDAELLGFPEILAGVRKAHDDAMADYEARAELLKTNLKVSGAAVIDVLDDLNLSFKRNQGEAQKTIDTISLLGKAIEETIAPPRAPAEDSKDEKKDKKTSLFKVPMLGGFLERAEPATESVFEALESRAQEFSDRVGNIFDQLGEGMWNTIGNSINMISTGFAQVLTGTANLFQVVKQIGVAILQQVIAVFIRAGLQRLVLHALNVSTTTTEASQSLAKSLAEVYANSFASAAAIPIVGWTIAPGVASANLALATAGAAGAGAAGAGLGSTISGQFHSGVDFVPREGSFLLDQGERVLSSDQNKDLTSFLSKGGGLSVQNMNIEILPNATSADSLLSMTPAQMRDIVEMKIITALDQLSRKGIKPRR